MKLIQIQMFLFENLNNLFQDIGRNNKNNIIKYLISTKNINYCSIKRTIFKKNYNSIDIFTFKSLSFCITVEWEVSSCFRNYLQFCQKDHSNLYFQ